MTLSDEFKEFCDCIPQDLHARIGDELVARSEIPPHKAKEPKTDEFVVFVEAYFKYVGIDRELSDAWQGKKSTNS